MLNRDTSGSSAVVELLIGLGIVLAVGFGVYQIQHPASSQQPQVTVAEQQ